MARRSKKETEALLAMALSGATPDVFEAVSQPTVPVGEAIRFTSLPRKKRPMASALAAACLLLVLGGGTWSWMAEAALIGIQVNPSLELSVNRWERVIGATPLNQDGTDLLSRVEWKYRELDEVAEDLAKELEACGYFKRPEAQVLVTAEGKSNEQALRWAGKVAHELEDRDDGVIVTVQEGRLGPKTEETPAPTPPADPVTPVPTPIPTPDLTPTQTPVLTTPTPTPVQPSAPVETPVPTPPPAIPSHGWGDDEDDWDDDDHDDDDDEDWDGDHDDDTDEDWYDDDDDDDDHDDARDDEDDDDKKDKGNQKDKDDHDDD